MILGTWIYWNIATSYTVSRCQDLTHSAWIFGHISILYTGSMWVPEYDTGHLDMLKHCYILHWIKVGPWIWYWVHGYVKTLLPSTKGQDECLYLIIGAWIRWHIATFYKWSMWVPGSDTGFLDILKHCYILPVSWCLDLMPGAWICGHIGTCFIGSRWVHGSDTGWQDILKHCYTIHWVNVNIHWVKVIINCIKVTIHWDKVIIDWVNVRAWIWCLDMLEHC